MVVEKSLHVFWNDKDISDAHSAIDSGNTNDIDDGDDDKSTDDDDVHISYKYYGGTYENTTPSLTPRQVWKDLENPGSVHNCDSYIRLHDCIAQLIARGLVKKATYPIALFRKAFEMRDARKGDPTRDAAFAAAHRYLYHGEEQIYGMVTTEHLSPHLGIGKDMRHSLE
ncbi:hypothetical protein PG990_006690 [Apiospora arundinis]